MSTPATSTAATSTSARASADPPSTNDPPKLAAGGVDLGDDAKALFRLAACDGDAPLPTGVDAKLVEKHCKALAPQVEKYKTQWMAVAEPFIAKLRPAGLPKTLVYPFGGADLVTALMVFPEATEITTISLEPAGDVRGFRGLATPALDRNLSLWRGDIGRLFLMSFHSTAHLDTESKTKLPGEILFTLLALHIEGYQPVSLRYFTIEKDGSIRYFEKADVDKATKGSHVFDDMELTFEKPGDPSSRKVLRHVAQNLDDTHFSKTSPLAVHLAAKGDVSAMTKAASHLLWSNDFSTIRDYLLDHAVWMISDSTGIPPRFATARGMIQDTYGTFDGPAPYGLIDPEDSKDFKELFEKNPKTPVSFFFGYWDVHSRGHIVVTRRPPR